MADRALICSVDNYNLTDDKTGEIRPLFQLWYINNYRESSPTERGSKPIKMVTTPEIFAQLCQHELPALFDLDLRSRPGKANSASLTVVGVTYVSTPVLFPPSAPSKQSKVA